MDDETPSDPRPPTGLDLPLARYALVATRDPDLAREQIGRIFCPHGLVLAEPGAASRFEARHHSAAFGGLTINFVSYGARVEIDPGCLDRIPRPFDFDPAIDLTRPRGAAILSQARLLQHLAESRDRPDSGPDAIERELASAFLTLIVGHMLEHGRGGPSPVPSQRVSVAPAHVRRAEDYIRAHLDAPLSLPHLAEKAGSSMRSLQDGFRQFRDSTISDFILAQRLDRWRALILAADPEAKVSDLALGVGLNHLSRAAGAYRDRFGEAPSQTLRQRRR